MAMPRVLCLWDVSFCPHVLDRLRTVAQVDIRAPERESVLAAIAGYDVVLAALSLPLDAELIARAGSLRIVVTPSTGLDHLDLAALSARGIAVQSIKEEFELLDRITATAEMAWALALAAARKLPMAHQAALRGDWARDRFRGSQIAGKVLGVLGVGRLGSMVARYGQAFGLRVLGCDPAPRKVLPFVGYVDLDTLLAQADILSIHVHLTPENRHLLDARAIAGMKDGAILVNTSRGGVVDETALAAALRSGKLGGAGLDVIDGEWRPDLSEHPLIAIARDHPNVVISPHLGGVTVESQAASLQFCADRLADTLAR
jgi:D-3-phosphoglycerate dehydrogenase